MATDFLKASLVLALSTLATAQYSGYGGGNGGRYNGYGNPYDNDGDSDDFFGRPNAFTASGISSNRGVVIAHGVLAAAAFVFIFPVGAILVRLGSFRGLWLVHGVIQAVAYLLYIAAAGIGIWITTRAPLRSMAHPIIGIILLALLFFQPILGFLHHFMFKKHSRRVVWSYGHIWIGRIAITLGIINGGLGLQLARRIGFFAPPNGAIIAYSVIAAIVWLAYVVSIVIGERRRARIAKAGLAPPPYKEPGHKEAAAARGVNEYYK